MSRARRIIEAEISTLVIHMEDPTTDFLKAIYAGKGYPVVSGPTTRQEMEELIQAHPRVFMLGHGGPGGLFARGLSFDDRFGPLLAEKPDGLYIWCNADAYAVRNKLSGLVSGMFISEVGEARMYGIEATQEQVDASNALFSRIVRETMDAGKPHSVVKQCYTHETCQIVKFNSERLYVFDHGTPTPALHPTSYGRSWETPDEPEHARAKRDAEAEELDSSEREWLSDYLAQSIEALQSGRTTVEDTAIAMYNVIAEFMPGYVDATLKDWLDDELPWAVDDPASPEIWAEDLIDHILNQGVR